MSTAPSSRSFAFGFDPTVDARKQATARASKPRSAATSSAPSPGTRWTTTRTTSPKPRRRRRPGRRRTSPFRRADTTSLMTRGATPRPRRGSSVGTRVAATPRPRRGSSVATESRRRDRRALRYDVVVCHANVIRFFALRALQLPPEGWLRLCTMNASITHITILPSGHVSLRTLGDIGHLTPEQITFGNFYGTNW